MSRSGSSFCSRVQGAWSVQQVEIPPVARPAHRASTSARGAQRRVPHVEGGLGPVEALVGELQVDGPGLDVHRDAAGPGAGGGLEGGPARQVDHVDGGLRRLGEGDRAGDRGALGGDGPGLREVLQAGAALGDEPLGEQADDAGVLAVHQGQQAFLAGPGQRAQVVAGLRVEPEEMHEYLHAGHAMRG